MGYFSKLLRPLQGQQRPNKNFRKLEKVWGVFPMNYDPQGKLETQPGPVNSPEMDVKSVISVYLALGPVTKAKSLPKCI